MTDPIIAAYEPIEVQLEAGRTYHWCSCGRSRSQPFCDGSHAGTGFAPLAFSVDGARKAWLCRCKHTGNPPWCDGSHARLAPPDAGDSAGIESTVEEPTLKRIHQMATQTPDTSGHRIEVAAMGVPRDQLPRWDDIQILPAQFATRPLPDNATVETSVIIGPKAAKPLQLAIPLLVSDMSFGAISEEAKLALAKGAELVGTGIGSGEGGMLAEEQQANSRYLWELGSAQFGYSEDKLPLAQAFHFKGGQAAKTGMGGFLPGIKVSEKIAKVRGLKPGRDAISPSSYINLHTPDDFRRFADRVREITGGIPIGFKLAASHIEADIDADATLRGLPFQLPGALTAWSPRR